MRISKKIGCRLRTHADYDEVSPTIEYHPDATKHKVCIRFFNVKGQDIAVWMSEAEAQTLIDRLEERSKNK
jgi:hypothetical protein